MPAPYLAAIEFLSSDTGVGLTASMIDCSIGQAGSEDEAFPVWQVVSTDGGRVWKAVGSALPKPLLPSFTNTDMAFSSPSRGWVEAGGALAYTKDGGRHWKLVRLGGTVTALQADGQTVAALVDKAAVHGWAAVWRLSPEGDVRWATSRIQASGFGTVVDELAVLPHTGELVVVVSRVGSGHIMAAEGAGSRWSRLGELCPDWGIDAVIATAGDSLAAVCGIGVGMNKEPKIFAVSLDGGRSWQTRSAWRTGLAPNPSGLPISDFFSVAASPDGDLYMATTMEAAASRDGGHNWVPIEIAGPGKVLPANSSAGGQFSFVSQTHGWLLWQSEALLQTVDGVHWTVLSSALPGT